MLRARLMVVSSSAKNPSKPRERASQQSLKVTGMRFATAERICSLLPWSSDTMSATGEAEVFFEKLERQMR